MTEKKCFYICSVWAHFFFSSHRHVLLISSERLDQIFLTHIFRISSSWRIFWKKMIRKYWRIKDWWISYNYAQMLGYFVLCFLKFCLTWNQCINILHFGNIWLIELAIAWQASMTINWGCRTVFILRHSINNCVKIDSNSMT